MGNLCSRCKKSNENNNEKEMSLIEINVDKEIKIKGTIEQIKSIKKIKLDIETDEKGNESNKKHEAEEKKIENDKNFEIIKIKDDDQKPLIEMEEKKQVNDNDNEINNNLKNLEEGEKHSEEREKNKEGNNLEEIEKNLEEREKYSEGREKNKEGNNLEEIEKNLEERGKYSEEREKNKEGNNLEEREKHLEEREKNLEEKEKNLEEKEKNLEEKDKNLEEKEKNLEEKEKHLEEKNLEANNLEVKEKNLEEKEKSLNEKDNNLKEKDKEINKKEKSIIEKEKELEKKDKDIKDKEKSLNETRLKQDEEINKKENELKERENKLNEKDKEINNKEKSLNSEKSNFIMQSRNKEKEIQEKEEKYKQDIIQLKKDKELLMQDKINFQKEKELDKLPFLIGLDNIGATCYMNSTLQALSNTEDLTKYFLNEFKYDPHDSTKILTNEYYKVLNHLWDKNKKKGSYAPKDFKEVLSKENSLFEGIQANDSKDLINFLLERFHNELNKKDNQQINIINDNIQFNETETLKCFLNNFSINYKSIISTLFYGVLETKYKCLGCNAMKFNFQLYSFLEFPLEQVNYYCYQNGKRNALQNIDGNNPDINLDECFEYHQKIDLMSGDNQMFCNFCQGNRDAYYGSTLYSLPLHLIIILNRGKNAVYECKVNFPEKLNLLNYVTFKDGVTALNLYAVICHHGPSSMSGHFTAYCHNRKDNKWYSYNDSMVNICNDSHPYNTGMPYILFYKAA